MIVMGEGLPRGVELSRYRSTNQEAFVSHANAALTPRARLRLARLVVDQGWPIARAAERLHVLLADRQTVGRRATAAWCRPGWPTGPAGPHRLPNRTRGPVVRKIVHLRLEAAPGPGRRSPRRLGMPASTVHAVLVRCRLNRLSHVDRATGEPIRRYEHDHPGR